MRAVCWLAAYPPGLPMEVQLKLRSAGFSARPMSAKRPMSELHVLFPSDYHDRAHESVNYFTVRKGSIRHSWHGFLDQEMTFSESKVSQKSNWIGPSSTTWSSHLRTSPR